MTERVLITGGAGFIGLHLARRLLADGADVTLLDDFSRGRPDSDLRGVSQRATLDDFSRGRPDSDLRGVSQRATVAEHDLVKPIPPQLLRGSFDHVYHLAGVVGVRQADTEPYRVLSVNVQSTMTILDWCRERPPAAIFLSSTSEIEDGAARIGLAAPPTPESVPYVVPDATLPRVSYALSKMVGETLLRHVDGIGRVRIARYHNIYGPRMGNDHVMPHFIGRALARMDPFPIYGAMQSRAFCYVDDAVTATIGLMRLPGAGTLVANVGNDLEEIRIDKLARRITGLAGYDPVQKFLDPPAGSADRRLPDLSVLRGAIGYEPTVPLEEGLRATFDWYTAHRPDAQGR